MIRNFADDNPIASFDVTDIVLKPNGSAAFILDGNLHRYWGDTRTVIKHDQCEGTRILDSSPRDVGDHSLSLRGDTLRWRHGRRTRTATLC